MTDPTQRAAVPIVKIGLVVVEDRGLLVVRKHGGRTFILPGGKPEGGESDRTCLEREIDEELGVTIAGPLDHLGMFEAPAADMPGAVVSLRAWSGRLHGDPSPRAEIAEMRWVDPRAPGVPLAASIEDHILPLVTGPTRAEPEDRG